MELVNGCTIKQALFEDETLREQLAPKIGESIAFLHNNDIIHGDLTTSNMLLRGDTIVIIDFGLSCISSSIEDRAVDLYVLERAITSTHSAIGSEFFASIIKQYGEKVTNSKSILSKLADVQKRGRKRDMTG